MASDLYNSAAINPTEMPGSALDATSDQPMDWLTNGLGKLLDAYVAVDAAHMAASTGKAAPAGYYRVPGTPTVTPVGGTPAWGGVSGGTVIIGLAVLAVVFLLARK